MFSSITSYLFGAGTEETQDQEQQQQPDVLNEPSSSSQGATPSTQDGHHCHLKTQAADDEWVLVDTSSLLNSQHGLEPDQAASVDKLRLTLGDECDRSNGSSPLGSPRRPTVVVSLSRSVDRLSDTSSGATTSGASTPVHVLYPSMEESWLVTPPPCFTAGGNSPQRMETGPMENLLIEHPSMSVYGPRGRQSSAGTDSNESSSEGDTDADADGVGATRSSPRATAMLRQPPRRPRAVAACAGLLAQVEANRSMQIVKQRQESRHSSRNKLSRSNKVHVAQNKQMRCKHYMLRPCGRSDSRKQY